MLRIMASKHSVLLLLSDMNLNLENRAQTCRVLNTKTLPELLNDDSCCMHTDFLKIQAS